MKPHKPPFLLKEIKIEVTQHCPMQCIHCSSDASPAAVLQMTEADCMRIVNEALAMGVREVAFSGGEPLTWKPLGAAVERVAEEAREVIIYTTGNVDNIAERLRRLKTLGLSRCVFSLFSANETGHEKITRCAGSFSGTIAAMKCADESGLNPEIHFVPLADNYSEIENVAELAGQLGVRKISVLRFVPHGRGALIQRHKLNKLQNLELRRAIARLRAMGLEIRTGSPYNFLLVNEDAECAAGINRLIIGPDLRIYPCDAFKQIKAEELVGTLEHSSLDKHPLSACWNRSPFLNAVRKYLTTPWAEPCASCDALPKCLSGCLAQKAISNGSIEKSADPDCICQ